MIRVIILEWVPAVTGIERGFYFYMASLLYKMIILPIIYLMDVITYRTYEVFSEPVIALLVLSVCVNVITMPLYNEADRLAAEEKKRQDDMRRWKKHLRVSFSGDERSMMLERYYRIMHYHPFFALKGSVSLLLQIPFFMAAYDYISGLRILQRVGAFGIADLAMEDGMIRLAGIGINLLPILMTVINIFSAFIYNSEKKDYRGMIQPVIIALVFLVLLYHSPSGLVLYWIFNNIISLVRNMYKRYIQNKKLFVFGCLCILPILYIYHDALALEKADWLTGYNNYFLLISSPIIIYVFSLVYRRFRKTPMISRLKADVRLTELIPVFLALAVLMGALIPLGVISAAPWDFTGAFTGADPVDYFKACIVLYFGLFVIWGSMLFIVLKKYRILIYISSVWILVIFTADHFINAGRFGFMNIYLVFDVEPNPGSIAKIINLLMVFGLFAGMLLVIKKFPKFVSFLVNVILISSIMISFASYIRIQKEEEKRTAVTEADIKNDDDTEKLLALDKNENNVLVIMLDRAISSYIPWIFEEKPQLKDIYDGFVYYPNTLSFGLKTITGAPAIFGGYEYTPEHINERSDVTLKDKHDEALRLMPLLFTRSGMDVTVCDMPYAGYDIYTGMDIYKEDEDVTALYLEREFGISDIDSKTRSLIQERMFALYSVFDVMPLCFSKQLYDRGNYQCVFGREHDLWPAFMAAYNALDNLPETTDISDDGHGKAVIMANNTTHELVDLQLPDYTPEVDVDNSAYSGMKRINEKGEELVFTTLHQEHHYKVDMAALLKLGEYFEFMKENGVYDNTRIIIVSDHGADIKQFEAYSMLNGELDITWFNPLLMVKDYDSRGFTTDTGLMTLADVPFLAMSGIVDDMVNPFTGKKMTDEEKKGELHVTASQDNDGVSYISTENTMFDTSDQPWFSVHDNIFSEDNWSVWKQRGDTIK